MRPHQHGLRASPADEHAEVWVVPADNSVNGVPSCANRWLLDTLARKEWRFDGYITSDCGADVDVWAHHNYTKTPEEAAAAILRAGQDIDCGGLGHLERPAASAGSSTEPLIQRTLSMLWGLKRLFMFGGFNREGNLADRERPALEPPGLGLLGRNPRTPDVAHAK